jgi:transcriptional regulator with XRE-family HTH domain
MSRKKIDKVRRAVVGRLIADLRETSKLTQSQVAHELQISRAAYSSYEEFRRDVPWHVFIDIAKLHGISLGKFHKDIKKKMKEHLQSKPLK